MNLPKQERLFETLEFALAALNLPPTTRAKGQKNKMGAKIYTVFNAYSIFHRLNKLELTDLQLDPITFITVSMRDSWIRVAPRFKCFKLEHTLKI